jgi:hypothetical protein
MSRIIDHKPYVELGHQLGLVFNQDDLAMVDDTTRSAFSSASSM